MGSAARSAAMIVLVICFITIGAAQVIGAASETLIVADYHNYAGETYLLYIRDMTRNFRLWLAGTRCFKPLSAWLYTNFYQELNSGYSDLSVKHSVERQVYRDAAFIAHLHCP